jgi:hypothetical protein
MNANAKISDWREFEKLVARIETDADKLGLTITSPDKIRSKVTGKLREVDASIRMKAGTSNVLITIECRKRKTVQDVTWIEQLATKRNHIGADRTIAVSATGFSKEAETVADYCGIDLRKISEVSIDEINNLIKLDFVLFTHKRCQLIRVGFRFFNPKDTNLPNPNDLDFSLSPETDTSLKLFKNVETDESWSVNDLWLQLQEITNPFAEIHKGTKAEVKTACFAYPGNVVIQTPNGKEKLGYVFLTLALALEIEKVDLSSANKIEYSKINGETIQRVEFSSTEPFMTDWRLSLQIPKKSKDRSQIRTRYDIPKDGKI